MTIPELIAWCMNKPGAYIDYPFGFETTIIKVKGKIFAQFFNLKGEDCLTFNCDGDAGMFYRQAYPQAASRGYHCPPVMQPYFTTVRLGGGVPDDVLKAMLDHSYARVVGRLPKKDRLALMEPAP